MTGDSSTVVGRTVADLLHSRAASSPEALAIRGLEGAPDMTYRQLHRASARVAAGLRAVGVEAGDVVAILLPRGVDYVIATLGTLLAGGVCLPMSPRDPSSRVSAVLRQNAARILVAPRGAAQLGEPPTLEMECLLAAEAGDAPAESRTGEDLAFVFATSGSTGIPKSVRLSHRACVSQLGWVRARFGLGERDVHLFKTSPNFVSVLRQLIWPLASGGSIVVLPDGRERDLRYLANTIAQQRVTFVTFIPSSLRLALQYLRCLDVRALRHVVCGGEPLDAALQAAVFELSPDVALHNVYAMSEAPLVAHWECSRAVLELAPVGFPVPGIEVATDGDGVLRVRGAIFEGYSGDDPRSADGWFVTGDVVSRQAPDGPLYYGGRADKMVKIRGFRVEPAEVEAVLLGHPQVREAIVEPHRRSDGIELVAYVLATATEAELRELVARALPEYMVPGHWHLLAELPMLDNGKVDRQALDQVHLASRRRAGGQTIASSSSSAGEGPERLCAQIREIWERTLGVRSIGIDESFLSLGGDSLRALEIALQVEALVGRELPFEVFAGSPTVRALARACERVLGRATPISDRVAHGRSS